MMSFGKFGLGLFVTLLHGSVIAYQNFQGADDGMILVTCPMKDYLVRPCTPTLLEVNQCNNLQSCSTKIPPSNDYSNVVIPLACGCLNLINCPDSCIATEVDAEQPPSISSDIILGDGAMSSSATRINYTRHGVSLLLSMGLLWV